MRGEKYLLRCVLFLCITLCVGMGRAEEFVVSDGLTFQQALNRAQSNDDNDTITLLPATYRILELLTYYAKQDVSGQPPHIENYSLTIDGGNYTKTILDSNGNRLLRIDTLDVPEAIPITVTIKNITFKNAGGENPLLLPGAVLSIAGTAASIRIENCAFIDNRGSVELLNTVGSITVRDSMFSGNSGAYQGAGIFLSSATGILILEKNTFIGNNSATEGGGAYCIISKEGTITVSNNVFNGNHATSRGAALAIVAMDGGQIHVSKNTFEQNRVGDTGGGAYLCSYDIEKAGSITITENTFTGNTAMHGGGISVVATKAQLRLSHSVFKQNLASLKGGAVFSEIKSSGASIINSVFAENNALEGAGIYGKTDSGEILITNTTCVNNTLHSGGQGGGLYAYVLSHNARVSLYNSILHNNTGGTPIDDIYINDDGDDDRTGAPVQCHHNVYTSLTVKAGDQMTVTHTLGTDPLVTADYHLQSGSPCIDAGSNAAPQISEKDIDFSNRIIDGDKDGEPVVDIGADEYDPATPPTTTTTTTIPRPECIIQTIYGEQAEEVATLRRFRDQTIARIPAGGAILRLYYRVSALLSRRLPVSDRLGNSLR